jgi:hypothetical protein
MAYQIEDPRSGNPSDGSSLCLEGEGKNDGTIQ